MASRSKSRRGRVGSVSFYLHHGAWWLYYRDAGKAIRRKAALNRDSAERIAAEVNGQLATSTPTHFSFEPIGVSQLRTQFLAYHEAVLHSTLGTVRRYQAATAYLDRFASEKLLKAHEVKADAFVAYLRTLESSPNGHPNTAKRRLRESGILFILETCRSLFAFAAKRRHLQPYAPNPFAELPLARFKVEDAKPIFVFDAETEFAFLKACDPWAFAIHFLLAKTGMRVGELTHLLIEDLDLVGGWVRVRNKPGLDWRVKTGADRLIPLLPECVSVLRHLVASRDHGVVFRRRKFARCDVLLPGNSQLLEVEAKSRLASAGNANRSAVAAVFRTIWRDAGAVKPDSIRTDFLRRMKSLGHCNSTCPKSWRHTFATLLQDANVDPLIRQLVLGHSSSSSSLKTTAHYTHTRTETMRRQIEDALRLWPRSLTLGRNFCGEQGGSFQ